MAGHLRFFLAVVLVWALALFLLFPDPLALLAANWPLLVVAFAASVFATATSVGGGFLFIPVFLFGYGLAPLAALKLSLSTQAFGMTTGALCWSRINIRVAPLAIALAAAGTGMLLGTYALAPRPELVSVVFGWVSVATALAVFTQMRLPRRPAVAKPPNRLPLVFLCLLGGLATAWTSIGISAVVALWLLFAEGERSEAAIATGAASLAGLAVLGALLHAGLGGVPTGMLAMTAPAVVLGGRCGVALGKEVERRWRALGKVTKWPGYTPLKGLLAAILLLNGLAVILVHPPS
ncbi:sulfite exporter TauE/SafE family protein [bacterium]|nr:sulfite exporter TauE/SafE family protein [bacterium]